MPVNIFPIIYAHRLLNNSRSCADEDDCSDSEDEVEKSGGYTEGHAEVSSNAGKGKLAQFAAADKRGKGAPEGASGQAVCFEDCYVFI